MGLDVFLEADERLSIAAVEKVLNEFGALDLETDGEAIEGYFNSGLSVRAERSINDKELHAEETQGLSFPVGTRCYFRIKGHEPDGMSSLNDLARLIQCISTESDAYFLVSFQYETLMYWRDEAGLHVA